MPAIENLDDHRRRSEAVRNPDVYLTARQVRDRYAVSDMTIWRWLQDEALAFPAPMVIRRRRLWKEADLVEWERRQAAKRG